MLFAQKQAIIERISDAVAPLVAGTDIVPVVTLERPKIAAHGDIACNVAMQIAKRLGQNPRVVAQAIVDALLAGADGLVERAEIAGPGFINLFLSMKARQAVVGEIFGHGDRYGYASPTDDVRAKVLVEFVSANPTGPLHVGHARGGAIGDVMAALLETQGRDVTREYYYNDAGVQIATLALSVQARARGVVPGDEGWPDAAYNGDYIAEIAADFVGASGDVEDLAAIARFAVASLRDEQDLDLKAFGITFDSYYLESSLYTDGRVARTVDELIAAGKTYESEGALWLATTSYPDLGDDKDRVMRKSDGTYTYFVPDIAYHLAKWERGFHKVINVMGSDHHGTVARVRAGLRAISDREHLGLPAIFPDYVLHKMVRVMRGGEEVKISKRAGSYVTLRDLIQMSGGEDVPNVRGRDAVRFFFITRKADTEFTFDIDLALAQSDENPVYYVQYAHARICSVLAQWGGADWATKTASLETTDLSPLVAPREVALMQRLAEFPDVLATAADEMAPHQLAFYLKDCAADLHSYYNAERVLVDDAALRNARAALLLATRQVIANGLALIGVSSPQKM
ncbi:MAG: arginine--tRNA ligase [Burkholderiaceae bacterium]